MSESQIQKFYEGANIFITGGTGFLGKILIEKLLRSTDVNLIYILVRDKKGKNIHTRADELFDDVIFDRLKKECPKFRHKIEAIPGDCSISGLGLNLEDRQKLITNTHVVFHVAATVRFDENLKLAYAINVNAIKEIIELGRQMKQLKSLMHVSTAYSNCHLPELEEKLYDQPINYEDVAILLEKLSKNEAAELTTRIIGKWPNTYTFTKALAESLIKNTGNGLPIGVFRPAIVVSTYNEPIPGWVDNMYGPTGVCAGGSSGLLRVVMSKIDAVADLIPVDTCVAGLIAAAWDVGTKKIERTVENIPVYNYVSSAENPITWGEYMALNVYQEDIYPMTNKFWHTGVTYVDSITSYNFLTFFYHIIPALFIDLFSIITGNKPRLLNMFKKIHKLIDVTCYFCLRQWKFSNDNTQKLYEKLNQHDKELFPMSMKNVHWLSFYKTYLMGIRRYLLKDPDSTLEAARNKAKSFYWLHVITVNTVRSFLAILAWSLFIKVITLKY